MRGWKSIVGLGLTAALVAMPARAEPIGRWWSGWGQGTAEYGIKNDSRGSDAIYIACSDSRTSVSFTVGGVEPKPGSRILVTVGADEFELMADEDGQMGTTSRVEADNFEAMWAAFRRGAAARVRLASGESTGFTLLGAAKALGREPCTTDFARF